MQILHNSVQETFHKVLLLRNTEKNCDWISHDGEYSDLLGMASCSLVTSYHRFVETRCLCFGVYQSIRFLRHHGTFPSQLHSLASQMTVILTADIWQSINNRNFITNSFHSFGMHNNAFEAIYCVWGTCIALECSNLSKIYPRNG